MLILRKHHNADLVKCAEICLYTDIHEHMSIYGFYFLHDRNNGKFNYSEVHAFHVAFLQDYSLTTLEWISLA